MATLKRENLLLKAIGEFAGMLNRPRVMPLSQFVISAFRDLKPIYFPCSPGALATQFPIRRLAADTLIPSAVKAFVLQNIS